MNIRTTVLISALSTAIILSNCRTSEFAKEDELGTSLVGMPVGSIESRNLEFCAGMLDGSGYDRFPQYAISTAAPIGMECGELYVFLEKSESRKADGSLNAYIVDALFVEKKHAARSLLTECWESEPSRKRAYVIFPDSEQWENSMDLEIYDISSAIGVDRSTDKLLILKDAKLKCVNEGFGIE